MYEINDSTVAIIPITENSSRIMECDDENIIINESTKNIINNSCRYFGSSYEGRLSGTKKILGVNYKAPIIIEESNDIIFFPTTSPRISNCIWLALKNIKDYKKSGKQTKIIFTNNCQMVINISYNSLDNQILRAARLQMLIKSRKIKPNY